MTGAFRVTAQVKKCPAPTYDFQKNYSFGDEFLLLLPDLEESKGLSEANPFTEHLSVKISTNLMDQMPILHPELDGYGMPIKQPSKEIDQSLLITPVPTEEDDH